MEVVQVIELNSYGKKYKCQYIHCQEQILTNGGAGWSQ